jgi:putative hemolysin
MSNIDLYVVLFVICLVFSAFFSGSETAFVSLQRVRVEHLVENKVRGAKRVSNIIARPERLLSTVLFGNTLVNTAAAAIATALAINFWGEHGVLYATLGLTAFLLIFTETTPKTVAAQHAERISLLSVRLLEFITWLFTPFVFVLSWIATAFSRLFGGTTVAKSLASPEEIRAMITLSEKEGAVEEAEADLLHKVFDFGDRPVSEVMVPRPEVIAIQQGAKISDFLTLYAESPLSRFPVYQDNMDNVVGILSVKDVLMARTKDGFDKDSTIDELVRPAYFAPESKRISDLFTEMRNKNFRMCVVVDEYGGTAGIVSLTRLVEEIVGPVGDELAEVEKDFEVINEYTFQVDGSMRIEEVNEEMELDLPEGDYETVAGFVLCLLGHIPRQNEQLRYRGLKLVITEMRGRKIEKILLTKEKEAVEALRSDRSQKAPAKKKAPEKGKRKV